MLYKLRYSTGIICYVGDRKKSSQLSTKRNKIQNPIIS